MRQSSGPLTLRPKRWFSWNFAVEDAQRHVADLDVSWWRDRGTLIVNGTSYRVYREGLVSGDFVLETDGGTLARATKVSAFRRAFELSYADSTYTLRARGPFWRSFVLESGPDEVGSIIPASFLRRQAVVTLPDSLPLPVKVFAMWLTVLIWKRDSEST